MVHDHVLVWLIALAIVVNGRPRPNGPRERATRRSTKKK